MTFIKNIKQEITKNLNKTLNKISSLSFLYGLFLSVGEINISTGEINFITNNVELLSFVNFALKKMGYLEAELEIDDEKNFKSNFKYKIIIDKKISENLLEEFIYKYDLKFNETLVNSREQKLEFIKSIFITSATGNITLNSEDSGYLIEFVFNDSMLCNVMTNLLSEFDIFTKKVNRKMQHVVYINKFEIISDLLALLGAINSMLEINNENALRSVRNNINRQNNCLEANMNKTINASLKQIEAINFIQSTIGLESLDESLQEICLVRLANKEESLDNLVKLMGGKISKSGLNHRLNKIIKISNELKDKF